MSIANDDLLSGGTSGASWEDSSDDSSWDDTRSLCARLEANDPSLTRLCVDERNHVHIMRIFEAMTNNVTLESLYISHCRSLSAPSVRALHEALCRHPKIEKLWFEDVHFKQFAPIVLTVLQNDGLRSLTLRDCSAPSQILMTENLNTLLHSNSLQNLRIEGCLRLRRNAAASRVFDGLNSTQCTVETLDFRRNKMDDDGVLILATALKTNVSVRYLLLSNNRIRRAGASALARALTRNNALEELCLEGNTVRSRGASDIAEALRSNHAIKWISLKGNEVGDVGAIALGAALKINSTVGVLNLYDNNIGHAGASALGRALTNNETLKEMNLTSNNIGSQGAEAIANGLSMNHSMEGISLAGNGMGDDGAVAVAHMLTTNKTVLRLDVGDFGERGLNAFITCLPQMQGLVDITVANVGFTTNAANALLCALEKNTVLTDLDLYENDEEDSGPPPEAIEILPKVEHLLALNAGGRRLLNEEPGIPPSVWPYVLSRSSNDPDVLFHFLREKPDVLIGNARANKRKHGILSSFWASALDCFGSRKRLRHN